MSIQSIASRSPAEILKNINTKPSDKIADTTSENGAAASKNIDTYTKEQTTKETSPTYTEPKKLSLEELKKLNDQRLESFKNTLNQMFSSQANKAGNKNFSLNISININISQSQSTASSDPTAPGGPWSSDAVSKNILDMAKSLSGGDASKISLLKNAVEKGFGAAKKAWGSDLPGVCGETYDKVMKGFDDWEKESKLES